MCVAGGFIYKQTHPKSYRRFLFVSSEAGAIAVSYINPVPVIKVCRYLKATMTKKIVPEKTRGNYIKCD